MTLRVRIALLASLLVACGRLEEPPALPVDREPPREAAPSRPVEPEKEQEQEPPSLHEELEETCRSFFQRLHELPPSCSLAEVAEVEALFVASCLAVVSAPGSLVTPASMRADCIDRITDCHAPSVCYDYMGKTSSLRGTLALGAPCGVGLQCASGRCSGSHRDGLCGVCQEQRENGEACAPPTLICQGGASCEAGVCVSSGQKLGEPCIDYGGGDCQPELFCNGDAGDGLHGFCQPRAGLGEACKETPCVEGMSCVEGLCVERQPDGTSCEGHQNCLNYCVDGVCQSPADGGELEGHPCGLFPCHERLTCSAQGICEPEPPAKKGEDCSGRACEPGLLCSRGYLPGSALHRCVEVPGTGEPCQDLRCTPRNICLGVEYWNGLPGVCTLLGLEGDPCPCVDELYCDQDTCRRAAPCGAP